MIQALLDTDTFIELLRGNTAIASRAKAARERTLGVSMITVFELHVGVQKSRSPEENERFLRDVLAPFVVLPFDEDAAQHAAKVRAILERKGRGIGPFDTLIAGHALSLNAQVITANTREFGRVPGLRSADWRAA